MYVHVLNQKKVLIFKVPCFKKTEQGDSHLIQHSSDQDCSGTVKNKTTQALTYVPQYFHATF